MPATAEKTNKRYSSVLLLGPWLTVIIQTIPDNLLDTFGLLW
jgi:hypothetical protein